MIAVLGRCCRLALVSGKASLPEILSYTLQLFLLKSFLLMDEDHLGFKLLSTLLYEFVLLTLLLSLDYIRHIVVMGWRF